MQTFTGKQYLAIDLANSYGLDGEIWNDRLNWYQAHADVIEQGTRDQILELARDAEEPAQFLAGVLAMRATLNGQPTGYLCGLDATASGLQLLSVLSGCVKSAQLCNLVYTGKREDAYTTTYEHVNHLLGAQDSYLRKAVKQALMTHLYGSKAVPQAVFGEDTKELGAFYQTIDTLLPGADQLNRELLALWQDTAMSHDWTLPDGFDVKVKVMGKVEHEFTFLGASHTVIEQVNQPQATGLSLGANIVHSLDAMVVREMGRRCNYDPVQVQAALDAMYSYSGTSTLREKDLALLRVLELHKQTGFMSLVVLEYLDGQNSGHLTRDQVSILDRLITTLPKKPFEILAIHDCFKFHANYGNDVRRQYREILAELAESDVLSSIATQITGRPVPVTKLDPNLGNLIRQSEYALS